MPPKNITNTNKGQMHNGNPLNLNQSSHQNNLNIPGNIQNNVNDTVNGMENLNIKQNDEKLIDDDKDISMDNMYEMLDSGGDITPQMDAGSTKSEKAKLMDDDYSRMMKERGNDLGMKSN